MTWHLRVPIAFGETLDPEKDYQARRVYHELSDRRFGDSYDSPEKLQALEDARTRGEKSRLQMGKGDPLPFEHSFRGVDVSLLGRYRPWQRDLRAA